MKILVAYSSKHGSTTGIAERIGDVLRSRGFQADVVPVDRAGALQGYGAVVLGSAVYAGGWRKDAQRFLQSHREDLANVPCWIFSSGPTGEGRPEDVLKGWTLPDALKPTVEAIAPAGVVVFHGALHAQGLGVIERLVVRGVGAPLGDFRDFAAIERWAHAIADALTAREAAPELATHGG